jgi:4-hydroxy-2-oxoheptanedioate aldolase
MTGRLRTALEQGRSAFGAWIMMSGPASIEVIGSAGFDYVCIDCQHGLLAYDDMRDLLLTLNGIDTSPIVRVPSNDAAWIGKALDAGAEGVIVPLVNTADDAVAAARACRYPPDGGRSFGPARRFQAFDGGPAGANAGVLCLPMIETRRGLENADAICATEGVDGIYIGPFDLALSSGLQAFSADHEEAIAKVRKSCTDAGIIPGIHAIDGAMAKGRSDQGFRLVTVIDDSSMLSRSASTELDAARS